MAAVSFYEVGAVEITKTYNHWLVKLHELFRKSSGAAVFSFDWFIKRSKLEVGGNLNRRFLIVEAAVFRRVPALNENPAYGTKILTS